MMQNGVTDEFVTALTGSQRRLHAYVLSLTADRHQAEEIVQETNLVLWRKADDFERDTNFIAWAFRVAYYQTLAYRQRQGRDRLVFDDEVVELLAEEYPAPQEVDARRESLEECLAKLTPRQRNLLNVRYRDGVSVERIAADLQRSANTVAQTLHRLRLALMECIQRTLAAGEAG
jgi:RNA polymerase sigma-70 factor (ECF subfamily)